MDKYELISRTVMFPHWILYLLSLAIVSLSVLNYQKEVISVHMKNIILNSSSFSSYSREETNFLGKLNWVLITNYAITTATVIYMLLIYFDSNAVWLIFAPLLYYILQITALRFTGLISGESKRLQENILLSSFSAHAIGILLIPVALIWMLNPQYSTQIIYFLILSLSLIHLLRIIRGVFSALKNKIAWYYIILYLCTFEIWPILIVYLLTSSSFTK